ncbi:hypothetical protein Tsubulata_019272 [Turnera subulata]|uniref:CSC1/OSCA1-like 7TM region domain-containing protein n=1 Tax=Turnera subulata TaxID=218843 RepID=A0A9Q0FNZ4_9ROSI|nr:hypothetical protein Tsubulata_019272 [Turnera subulata]
MDPESLLASAAINFGLAFIVISLFSILKKQPSNAPIYYARRLAKRHHLPFQHSLTLSRFLPSVSWIPRALRVTEDQVLDINGLDALVVIRLFKFGIKFFGVCSFIGVMVLVPVNYGGTDEEIRMHRSSPCSVDCFAISNVRPGSNRLWVHFVVLCFISFYGAYLLYKEYDGILAKRMQLLKTLRHRPDQFTVLVRQIPSCIEHKARGCSLDHFFSRHHPNSYHSCQMLYEGKEIENLSNQARYIAERIENLRKKTAAKKSGRVPLLLDKSQGDVEKLSMLEEKLQEELQKILHLQDRNMLQGKELPVAFATFKSRQGAVLVAQSQQHSDPLQWITEMAPEPRDVSWRSLAIPAQILPLYKIGVIVLAAVLTIFFAVPVTAVQGIAKFEKLKKWFPPVKAIQLIPGLSSIVTGYLPSAILKGFIYVVPFAMLGLAKLGGSISKSKEEIKACNMVFYFLVGNVFFLSLISGSLLDEIGEYFTHPRTIPSHLAGAVTAQADFFVTYILTDGLSGFSLEALQPGMLLWDAIISCLCRGPKQENPYLESLPYFRVIPTVSLSILIGTVYAVVAPLLLPVLVGYFYLGYVVYVNQIEDVYDTVYETCGKFWPYIHHYIFVAIILMQITMMGLFGLKSKPSASIATIPLLLSTLMFNEYCKIRFLPTFHCSSVKDAVELDELDQKSGQLEVNLETASHAYLQPSLRSIKITTSESSSTQPLLV